MAVDFTTPPDRETGQDQLSDGDSRSIEVSFDEKDLTRRGVELASQGDAIVRG